MCACVCEVCVCVCERVCVCKCVCVRECVYVCGKSRLLENSGCINILFYVKHWFVGILDTVGWTEDVSEHLLIRLFGVNARPCMLTLYT